MGSGLISEVKLALPVSSVWFAYEQPPIQAFKEPGRAVIRKLRYLSKLSLQETKSAWAELSQIKTKHNKVPSGR